MALILFNQQVSYSAYKKSRRIVDGHYTKYQNGEVESADLWENVRTDVSCVLRNRFVELFNWLSLISFLGGIGFLVAFVWRNAV